MNVMETGKQQPTTHERITKSNRNGDKRKKTINKRNGDKPMEAFMRASSWRNVVHLTLCSPLLATLSTQAAALRRWSVCWLYLRSLTVRRCFLDSCMSQSWRMAMMTAIFLMLWMSSSLRRFAGDVYAKHCMVCASCLLGSVRARSCS